MENQTIKDLTFASISDVKETSKRVRFTLFVLLISSILAFAGYWNSRPNSWQKARISNLTSQTESLQDSLNTCLEEFLEGDRQVFKELKKEKPFDLNKIKENTRYQLIQVKLNKLIEIYCEHTSHFTIPFLGIYFDIDDLGFLSGLSISILVLILFFSYNRELQSLRIASSLINKNEEGLRKHYFLLLSNTQILAIPPLQKLLKGFPSQNTLTRILKLIWYSPFFRPKVVFS